MVIGVDATNIREGGGLTHLKAFLQYSDPKVSGFSKIIVWSSDATLRQLPDYSFLQKESHSLLNKSTLFTFLYQLFFFNQKAKKEKCSVVFVPGGTFISRFRPFVTMSQNMLPFIDEESKQYGFKMKMRLKILFFTQSLTFKKANGLIFLTRYANHHISKRINLQSVNKAVIPHGINPRFNLKPRTQKDPASYTNENPFVFLYVSYVTVYKHQWNVAEAICQLHQKGFPVKLKLIGSTLDSFDKLEKVMDTYANSTECIEYIPGLPHDKLIEHYHNADAFVFASSCENQPIILLEAMSAGLPIVSSDCGPMEEVLGNSAIYFNPRKVMDIKEAIILLFENHKLREYISNDLFNKGRSYTWANCCTETLDFLIKTAKNHKN